MNEKRYPSQNAERIIVRLPDGMRDRLAVAARENKRSTNAEVVARLEESFRSGEYNTVPSQAEREDSRRAFLEGFTRAAGEIGETIAQKLGSAPQTGELFGQLFYGDQKQQERARRSIRKAIK